ncbi:hypothetical protein V1477_016994 [Vespula maculifrons]|uniref:Uncharacterized protein n=1 Tax=Vespula maculifrons TaxID=7453 RepID=A0ABD2B4S7_VESMC
MNPREPRVLPSNAMSFAQTPRFSDFLIDLWLHTDCWTTRFLKKPDACWLAIALMSENANFEASRKSLVIFVNECRSSLNTPRKGG